MTEIIEQMLLELTLIRPVPRRFEGNTEIVDWLEQIAEIKYPSPPLGSPMAHGDHGGSRVHDTHTKRKLHIIRPPTYV